MSRARKPDLDALRAELEREIELAMNRFELHPSATGADLIAGLRQQINEIDCRIKRRARRTAA
jgi:phage-related protein